MLNRETYRRAWPPYQSEEIRILNISIPRVGIEPKSLCLCVCMIVLLPLWYDWTPQYIYISKPEKKNENNLNTQLVPFTFKGFFISSTENSFNFKGFHLFKKYFIVPKITYSRYL